MTEPQWLDGDDVALGNVWDCEECGAPNEHHAPVCEDCGAVREGGVEDRAAQEAALYFRAVAEEQAGNTGV